jgi:hypothetical protein
MPDQKEQPYDAVPDLALAEYRTHHAGVQAFMAKQAEEEIDPEILDARNNHGQYDPVDRCCSMCGKRPVFIHF